MFKPQSDFEDLMFLVFTLEQIGYVALIGGGTVTFVDEQTNAYYTEKYSQVEELREKLYTGCIYTYKTFLESKHNENELGFAQFANVEHSQE